MREILIRMSLAITQLEKELDAIPEQTMFYDSENSEKTIDPEYQRDR